MPIRIIIADDHQMVREGLKQLLEFEGDMEVVAQANDGRECLELLEKIKADVLLLDINMPNENGLEVLRSIKAKNYDIKVLILTIHNEIEYLLKSIDAGINGYMLKDSESAKLKEAINVVYNGDIYIQPSLSNLLNVKLIDREVDRSKKDALTKREIEVLKQLAEGLFNKEIASKLNITERTVKNHVSNIFKKINVSDRTQAAVFAIRNNIIDLF